MIDNPNPPGPQRADMHPDPTVHKALVLGGGSLKGAFQAGAVLAILETGFQPDAIYGISVGSLNATFLAHEVARQEKETGQINWPKAGRALMEFWIRNITRPDDVAVERSRFRTGYDTLLSRFDGFLDNSPIKNLIRQTINLEQLRGGSVHVKVGAVDILNGDMVYADAHDEHFLDYVFASSALPFLMPAVQIGGDHRKAFMDGGLREVAPLRVAIEDGARQIVGVACHAKRIPGEAINYRGLLTLIERVKDITVNQLVNNDIAWAERYADRERLRGNPIDLMMIRPVDPLHLDLLQFTSDDISRLVVEGYKVATAALKS
ncbi:patatin-like phospholipase family protein [Rudanella lutea]|uniref:patatin-like phospholipase family protein n=1 Tax=Rudanella lutea TaxID=451374 RepID=UPI00036D7C50|nr:patatin-like phospholipase family protein [Rudanella lutea]